MKDILVMVLLEGMDSLDGQIGEILFFQYEEEFQREIVPIVFIAIGCIFLPGELNLAVIIKTRQDRIDIFFRKDIFLHRSILKNKQ